MFEISTFEIQFHCINFSFPRRGILWQVWAHWSSEIGALINDP